MEQNLSLFLVYHFHDFIFILLNLLLLFFWPALGILVPLPGIEPTPTSLEVWSLNYWTTRAVPYHRFLTPQSPLLFQAVFALPPPEQHPTTARRHTSGWSWPVADGGHFPRRVAPSLFLGLCEIGCSFARCHLSSAFMTYLRARYLPPLHPRDTQKVLF